MKALRKYQSFLLKVSSVLEIVIACIVLITTIFVSCMMAFNTLISLENGSFNMEEFMSVSLSMIVGIEFVKMLLLHTPESIIEVLLYAVARQIILSHDSALENLIGVLAVAIIFMLRSKMIPEVFGGICKKYRNEK